MTVVSNDTSLGLEGTSRMPTTPIWAVLGFPVFTILRSLGVKLWFFPMALTGLLNSALWGALAAMLAAKLQNRPRITS